MGFVHCRVRSKGRYGRSREIKASVPDNIRDELIRAILQNLDIPQTQINEVIRCTQTRLTNP